MSTKGKVWIGIGAVLVVAIVVIVLWPAPDPLADAQTVAIRTSSSASASSVDFQEELQLVLSGRDLRIVPDESTADLVITLDEVRVNLGDVEISLSNGNLRGRASAVCIVTDVRSGKTYTMDLLVRFDADGVHASLVGRKFWQFWK
jgi:hypothetical protein